MPSARARSSTASSSEAKSGKSRWQWLSTSMRQACPTEPLNSSASGSLDHPAPLGGSDRDARRQHGLARLHVNPDRARIKLLDPLPQRDRAFVAFARCRVAAYAPAQGLRQEVAEMLQAVLRPCDAFRQ